MGYFTRCWIFPFIFCSLYAFTQQTYIDLSPDYGTVDEKTDEEFSPYINKLLLQALKNSYYNSPPSSSAADPEPYYSDETAPIIENIDTNEIVPSKRSRYYRKYPGKRQNQGLSDVYRCIPNTRDTVRLLYAIHQARQGGAENIVFCNRVRNPKVLITNPRYVGKRAPGAD